MAAYRDLSRTIHIFRCRKFFPCSIEIAGTVGNNPSPSPANAAKIDPRKHALLLTPRAASFAVQ
jgi:hypothetical protein